MPGFSRYLAGRETRLEERIWCLNTLLELIFRTCKVSLKMRCLERAKSMRTNVSFINRGTVAFEAIFSTMLQNLLLYRFIVHVFIHTRRCKCVDIITAASHNDVLKKIFQDQFASVVNGKVNWLKRYFLFWQKMITIFFLQSVFGARTLQGCLNLQGLCPEQLLDKSPASPDTSSGWWSLWHWLAEGGRLQLMSLRRPGEAEAAHISGMKEMEAACWDEGVSLCTDVIRYRKQLITRTKPPDNRVRR